MKEAAVLANRANANSLRVARVVHHVRALQPAAVEYEKCKKKYRLDTDARGKRKLSTNS